MVWDPDTDALHDSGRLGDKETELLEQTECIQIPREFMQGLDVNEDSPTSPRDSSSTTSYSLLERVRGLDAEAWRRFVNLYGPVVFDWCQRAGLQTQDAADATQEVFCAVHSNIAKFRRDRPGDSFRAWLRTITANKVRDQYRAQRRQLASHDSMDDVPAPDPAHFDSDPQPIRELAKRALALIQTEFEPKTAQAFWAVAVSGLTPQQAAADLGMSLAAVYKAKSRLLSRLRQELDGLLD